MEVIKYGRLTKQLYQMTKIELYGEPITHKDTIIAMIKL